jgi:hypothetical protein
MSDLANPRSIAVTLALLAVAAIGGLGVMLRNFDRTHPNDDSTGEPGLAKPTPAECDVAKSLVGAFHADGEDKTLLVNVPGSLSLRSLAYRSTGLPDLASDQAANVAAKTNGDWRWCPGLAAYARSLGWNPMGDFPDPPDLSLTRAAMSSAGDRAILFEKFTTPGRGAAPLGTVTWLVTLRRADASSPTWGIDSRREWTPPHS